ncbi:DNA glycosylase [Coprinopsis sp. MPI-PUGE-AT-0042]|nr:DNA glycosylase [Coprinopsis sp. MPI-PUGE-AT-0042]
MSTKIQDLQATPKRSRKKGREDIHSPYFSPSPLRRRQTSKQMDLPTLRNATKPLSTQAGSFVLKETDIRDPLVLFNARNLECLHEQIVKLKPTLIQETVAHDPWKLLIAVTLLNKTSGKLAIPAFWKLTEQWPTPYALSQASEDTLITLLTPLGTQRRRARRLIRMSEMYVQDPPSNHDVPLALEGEDKVPSHPHPGAGPYALDSYRIFCTMHQDTSSTEWKEVLPTDKELIRYLRWKWAAEERLKWSPAEGPGDPVNAACLKALQAELTPK